MGFPGGASGKESTCQCRRHETWVWSLDQEDPLEEETHASILAWTILRTEESGGLYSSWGRTELDTTEWLSTWVAWEGTDLGWEKRGGSSLSCGWSWSWLFWRVEPISAPFVFILGPGWRGSRYSGEALLVLISEAQVSKTSFPRSHPASFCVTFANILLAQSHPVWLFLKWGREEK